MDSLSRVTTTTSSSSRMTNALLQRDKEVSMTWQQSRATRKIDSDKSKDNYNVSNHTTRQDETTDFDKHRLVWQGTTEPWRMVIPATTETLIVALWRQQQQQQHRILLTRQIVTLPKTHVQTSVHLQATIVDTKAAAAPGVVAAQPTTKQKHSRTTAQKTTTAAGTIAFVHVGGGTTFTVVVGVLFLLCLLLCFLVRLGRSNHHNKTRRRQQQGNAVSRHAITTTTARQQLQLHDTEWQEDPTDHDVDTQSHRDNHQEDDSAVSYDDQQDSIQDSFHEEDDNDEEEEEDWSDNGDYDGIDDDQHDDWQDDEGEDEFHQEYPVDRVPAPLRDGGFRFSADDNNKNNDDVSSHASSSLGPLLPPVMERYVVRPKPARGITFEAEVERFTQLQLGSPRSLASPRLTSPLPPTNQGTTVPTTTTTIPTNHPNANTTPVVGMSSSQRPLFFSPLGPEARSTTPKSFSHVSPLAWQPSMWTNQQEPQQPQVLQRQASQTTPHVSNKELSKEESSSNLIPSQVGATTEFLHQDSTVIAMQYHQHKEDAEHEDTKHVPASSFVPENQPVKETKCKAPTLATPTVTETNLRESSSVVERDIVKPTAGSNMGDRKSLTQVATEDSAERPEKQSFPASQQNEVDTALTEPVLEKGDCTTLHLTNEENDAPQLSTNDSRPKDNQSLVTDIRRDETKAGATADSLKQRMIIDKGDNDDDEQDRSEKPIYTSTTSDGEAGSVEHITNLSQPSETQSVLALSEKDVPSTQSVYDSDKAAKCVRKKTLMIDEDERNDSQKSIFKSARSQEEIGSVDDVMNLSQPSEAQSVLASAEKASSLTQPTHDGGEEGTELSLDESSRGIVKAMEKAGMRGEEIQADSVEGNDIEGIAKILPKKRPRDVIELSTSDSKHTNTCDHPKITESTDMGSPNIPRVTPPYEKPISDVARVCDSIPKKALLEEDSVSEEKNARTGKELKDFPSASKPMCTISVSANASLPGTTKRLIQENGQSPFTYVSTLSPDSRASSSNWTDGARVKKASSKQLFQSAEVHGSIKESNTTKRKHESTSKDDNSNQINQAQVTADSLDALRACEADEVEVLGSRQTANPCPDVVLSVSLRNAIQDLDAPVWQFSSEEALKPVEKKRRHRKSKRTSSRKRAPFMSPQSSSSSQRGSKRKHSDTADFMTPPLTEPEATNKRRAKSETALSKGIRDTASKKEILNEAETSISFARKNTSIPKSIDGKNSDHSSTLKQKRVSSGRTKNSGSAA